MAYFCLTNEGNLKKIYNFCHSKFFVVVVIAYSPICQNYYETRSYSWYLYSGFVLALFQNFITFHLKENERGIDFIQTLWKEYNVRIFLNLTSLFHNYFEKCIVLYGLCFVLLDCRIYVFEGIFYSMLKVAIMNYTFFGFSVYTAFLCTVVLTNFVNIFIFIPTYADVNLE